MVNCSRKLVFISVLIICIVALLIGLIVLFRHEIKLAYIRSVTSTVKGNSFNGLTTQQIAETVPGEFALVLEIVNYSDANLEDGQLLLGQGLEHHKGPATIRSKTTEIFTFKHKEEYELPLGVLKYRVGETGFSFHLMFSTGSQKAAGFLKNYVHVSTLLPIAYGCDKYTNTASPASFVCIQEDSRSWNTTRSFIIHQDSIYAKFTLTSFVKTSIFWVEIF